MEPEIVWVLFSFFFFFFVHQSLKKLRAISQWPQRCNRNLYRCRLPTARKFERDRFEEKWNWPIPFAFSHFQGILTRIIFFIEKNTWMLTRCNITLEPRLICPWINFNIRYRGIWREMIILVKIEKVKMKVRNSRNARVN